MRIIKIVLCFLIILSFVSCGESEFMNLYAFTDNYNKTSESKLNISDFYFQNDQKGTYTAFLGDTGYEVLLTVKSEESDIIEEVQISIIKDKSAPPDNAQLVLFCNTLRNTLRAFCNYDTEQAETIISAFELNDNSTFAKEGELTLTQNNFHFVYYSTKLISQIMIYNTYLHKIEETEKPVSKPYYAEDFIIKNQPD